MLQEKMWYGNLSIRSSCVVSPNGKNYKTTREEKSYLIIDAQPLKFRSPSFALLPDHLDREFIRKRRVLRR